MAPSNSYATEHQAEPDDDAEIGEEAEQHRPGRYGTIPRAADIRGNPGRPNLRSGQ
jgi:hypothetical protein